MNQPKAVFAIDLDGTLLTDDHELTGTNIRAIRRARELGCPIVLATGRSLYSARAHLDMLGIDGYLIAANGALVSHGPDDLLFAEPLPAGTAQDVADIARRNSATIHLTGLDASYSTQDGAGRDNLVQELLPGSTPWTPITFAQLPQLVAEHEIFKAAVSHEDFGVLARVKDCLFRAGLPVVSSDRHYVEVMHPGVNKGSGLVRLLDSLGLQECPVMAFGDQENDVELLRVADIAVAMGNAVPAVKRVADHVVEDNNDSAVGMTMLDFLEHPEEFVQR